MSHDDDDKLEADAALAAVEDLALRELLAKHHATVSDPAYRERNRRLTLAQIEAHDARLADEQRAARLVALGVPRRLAELALKPSSNTEADVVVRRRRERPVLVIAGATGRGKSLAAARRLLHLGRGRWITADELRQITRHRGDRQLFEAWMSTRALVIDDVGAEVVASDADAVRFRKLLENLLARRVEDGGETVITTRLPGPEMHRGTPRVPSFERRYGPSLWSRLERWAVYRELGRGAPERTRKVDGRDRRVPSSK